MQPNMRGEKDMKSYWMDCKQTKQYPKLIENLETDICIIGGGLTGITTAYYLNKYKIKKCHFRKRQNLL